MTRQEFLKDYWQYYLMLEKQFVNTLQYVDLDNNNFTTFSNQYANLLQAIGSELDSFFKVYCSYNPDDYKFITDYANFVLSDFPSIVTQEVEIINYNTTIKPFDGWDATRAKQSLPWWESFDKIKHSRTSNKSDASLEKVLNALGGLFIIEMKYLQKIVSGLDAELDIPNELSALFELKDWAYNYIPAKQVYFPTKDGDILLGDQVIAE